MPTMENPANGYRESVTFMSVLGALVFGLFWFALNGLWTHFVIQLLAIIALFSTLSVLALVILVPMWLVYAALAPAILKKSYLRRGWREVA